MNSHTHTDEWRNTDWDIVPAEAQLVDKERDFKNKVRSQNIFSRNP
jgi:hypothetical protein